VSPQPVTPPTPEPSAVSQTVTNQPVSEPTTTSQVTAQAPAVQPAATVPSQPVTPPAPEPSAVSQTATNQPTPEPMTTSQVTTQAPAVQPAATVPPQPVAPPAPAVAATPLAPPPNPIPPAPAGGTMTADQGTVIADTNQPGGAPAGATQTPGQPIALIFFADASAGLSNRDKNVLHDVYLLQQQQGGRLRIVGHASQRTAALDPARDDQANYKLSAARANEVAHALRGMGVPDGAISIVAEGSQAPAFYEFTPTGEAGNRRVDIYLDR
jgi:outer membrane protein OmpA-like peptidoglycan-associated protein